MPDQNPSALAQSVAALIAKYAAQGGMSARVANGILAVFETAPRDTDAVARIKALGLNIGEELSPNAVFDLDNMLAHYVPAPDLLFLDTETLGLDPYAPIWELCATRTTSAMKELATLDMFITPTAPERWLATLPDTFREDFESRFDPDGAVTPYEAAQRIHRFASGKPLLVGSAPGFDAEHIARQWLEPLGLSRPWHHHTEDIATLAQGFLRAHGRLPEGPWTSDMLSALIGVLPDDYPRHTARGDVDWVMAQWKVIHG